MSEVLVHPTAIVSPKAQLGQCVQVCAYAVVEHDTIIGDHTIIGHHVIVHAGTRIGKKLYDTLERQYRRYTSGP